MKLQRRVLGYLAAAAIASCVLTVGVGVALLRHQIAKQRLSTLEAQANLVAAVGGAPGALTPGDHVYRVGSGRPRRLGPRAQAVVLSYLLARRLTRPIGELSAATLRLAAGEQDVAVPVRGEDELADLGASFNEMSGELSRARVAQGRFLEPVSHELRTPLTSIRGYSEALEEQAVTPTEAARVIGSEADRLERLVADLLDLARFGRSDCSVAREPVDLAGVVEQSVQRHLRRARDIGVELSGAGAAETWVLGDQDRILQPVSNLIENALRITLAGGSVTVDAGPGQISVRDAGPGLDPEDIPRAFERFYLYGRYRSERPVGSGLGLAIVQELICAMGGTVEASTPPGGGAEFKIRLPSIPARSALPDAVRPSA